MLEMLRELRKRVVVGVVGGSDLVKQKEQLGDDGSFSDFSYLIIDSYSSVLDLVDYSFSENGLVAYHNGKLIHSKVLDRISVLVSAAPSDKDVEHQGLSR